MPSSDSVHSKAGKEGQQLTMPHWSATTLRKLDALEVAPSRRNHGEKPCDDFFKMMRKIWGKYETTRPTHKKMERETATGSWWTWQLPSSCVLASSEAPSHKDDKVACILVWMETTKLVDVTEEDDEDGGGEKRSR